MNVNRVADLEPEMIHFKGTMEPAGVRDFFANPTVLMGGEDAAQQGSRLNAMSRLDAILIRNRRGSIAKTVTILTT